MRAAVFFVAAAALACSKSSSPPDAGAPDAEGVDAAPTAPTTSTGGSLLEDAGPHVPPEQLLRGRFDGSDAGVPPSVVTQTVPIAGTLRHASLAYDGAKPFAESKPIVWVTDEEGLVLWRRDRPVAGILPPTGAMSLAAGARGRVGLAVCDMPTRSVALRLWDDDGAPFADFSAMDVEGCDALTLYYWPSHGWVIVAVRPGQTRAQLLSDRGSGEWKRGIDVGVRPRIVSPASVAADSKTSIVMVERAPTDTGAPDRVLAFRFDATGASQWTKPVDLGETRLPAGQAIALERVSNGTVRATLGKGLDVDVSSTGDVAPQGSQGSQGPQGSAGDAGQRPRSAK